MQNISSYNINKMQLEAEIQNNKNIIKVSLDEILMNTLIKYLQEVLKLQMIVKEKS